MHRPSFSNARTLSFALPLSLGLSACGSSGADVPASPDDPHAVLPTTGPDAGAPSSADAGDAKAPPTNGNDAGPRADPGCDGRALPSESPCVIDERYGVFVSASLGRAGADGTRTRPFASLNEGLSTARNAGKRLYVCAETYQGSLGVVDGVSVFGTFDCGVKGWTVGSSRAVLLTDRIGITARSIGKPTRLEGLRIIVPDATGAGPGQSAIGMLALQSPGLTLVRVAIQAGAGADGRAGSPGDALHGVGTPDGAAPVPAVACEPGAVVCGPINGPKSGGAHRCARPDGSSTSFTSTGGAGGDGGVFEKQVSGYPFMLATVVTISPAGLGNLPRGSSAELAAAGSSGANGQDGTLGTSGGEVGRFGEGYGPADGSLGGNGGTGQAGGGGHGRPVETGDAVFMTATAGTHIAGAPGGGGGAGGCPGLSGTPGQGGGASIGIILIDSPIRIEASTVETAQGGKGGPAGLGSAPTAGGRGGSGVAGAMAGGNGGRGGNAGASGSGGGGPSIALAFKGGTPTVVATSLNPGNPGAGVSAQSRLGVPTVLASPAGLRAATYAIP